MMVMVVIIIIMPKDLLQVKQTDRYSVIIYRIRCFRFFIGGKGCCLGKDHETHDPIFSH
jgi:hypothetical protein